MVVVQAAPPAPRVVVRPPAPSPTHVWVEGNWIWRRHAYRWSPGRWQAARHGHRWEQARWEEREGAWVLVPGVWVVAD